jgi:ParB family chromosome partitioning protein
MPRKTGLGRGLSALIPGADERDDFEGAPSIGGDRATYPRIPVTEVDLDRIVANPQQPRSVIDAQELAELTESIRAHGVIQPLLVSEIEDADPAEGGADTAGRATAGPRYQLIAGERRWRAARNAGLMRVPVTIRQTTPRELLELAIVENVQRSDLNPLEEAFAYGRLAEEFALTQREIAERVGRSRTAVANTMRLVELPEEIRASLARAEISEGHARALLGLPLEVDRLRAWRRVIDEGLNVRQTERMVRAWGRLETARTSAPRPVDPDTEELAERLRRRLGTKVTLRRSKRGNGSVTLHFYSDEELDGLLDRLLGDGRLQ